MSEDRRKKQQSDSDKPPRKYLNWIGIAFLFALAYSAGWYYKNHRYDNFAKCMASKQAKMYGLYSCPHCADQKAMLGASFHHVPYVECGIRGVPHELAPECQAAGVNLFPSWQFGSDPPKAGVLSLQELSEKTGCSLP